MAVQSPVPDRGRGDADPAVARFAWPVIAEQYDRFLRELQAPAP